MSILQRQHIRFSLDIPAIRQMKYGEAIETVLHQISIGGCLLEWDENIFVGDEIRILARMRNGNYIPLTGKALYIFDGVGIGIIFKDITRFEQQLLADLISQTLEEQNLPMQVDPFSQPRRAFKSGKAPETRIPNEEERTEELTDEV